MKDYTVTSDRVWNAIITTIEEIERTTVEDINAAVEHGMIEALICFKSAWMMDQERGEIPHDRWDRLAAQIKDLLTEAGSPTISRP